MNFCGMQFKFAITTFMVVENDFIIAFPIVATSDNTFIDCKVRLDGRPGFPIGVAVKAKVLI
jgi:hypothetical protein